MKRIELTNTRGPGRLAEVIPELSDPVPWRYMILTWDDETPLTRGIHADEKILRGADWLTEHRASGRESFIHVALTNRAEGLTREEFGGRWQRHAGKAGGAVIPREDQGEAYVQNHALQGTYDAVNEAYFLDRAGLETRVAWFRGHRESLADDLFQPPTLVAVHEAGRPIERGSR